MTTKPDQPEMAESCATIPGPTVHIRTDAFAACRYGVMVLLWAAFWLREPVLLIISFILLLLSALVTVKYSPIILIYTWTIGLVFKAPTIPLGVAGMRFAHSLGAFFSGLALLCYYFIHPTVGWAFVFFLSVMKTISALGICPAYKIYNCVMSGGCCSLSKRWSKS